MLEARLYVGGLIGLQRDRASGATWASGNTRHAPPAKSPRALFRQVPLPPPRHSSTDETLLEDIMAAVQKQGKCLSRPAMTHSGRSLSILRRLCKGLLTFPRLRYFHHVIYLP